LESANTLKFLAINSTGYDLVDVVTSKGKGIQVANVPGFSTDAVAEHAFALMLAVSKKVPAGDVVMRRTPFQIDPASQEQRKYLGFNLQGKTLGVVGIGSIGSRVAQIGMGFGMKVLAFNRSEKNVAGIKQVSLEELLKESDIVSLHLPLTPATENLITAERLQMMKPTAILINTARGKMVDESALMNALQSHKLAGAGLDTIVEWKESNPLLVLDNVVFSPHSAFFTNESLENCANIIVANVKSFIEGNPVNIVNL
jgi:D-3-phosphoglycerate dehydrogenase